MSKGFSLAELVISMCIIALLSLAATPYIGNVIQQAKDTQSVQNLNAISTAMQVHSLSFNSGGSLLTLSGGIREDLSLHMRETLIPQSLTTKERNALAAAGITELTSVGEIVDTSQAATVTTSSSDDCWCELIDKWAERIWNRWFVDEPTSERPSLPVHNRVIAIGINDASEVALYLSLTPTDPNSEAGNYEGYIAYYWLGSDLNEDGSIDESETFSQAEFLGVTDSRGMSKEQLASRIIESK